ncbi:MAG TPA: response regulator transcription factor [Pilimelia sp.]|nr:response regulator transcription factor [Pilimelia sp.]
MIRVLVVDDHALVRQGLRFLLEQEADIEVVGECADGPGAVAAVRALAPTVVLLDLFLPGVDGLTVLDRIIRERPAPAVVMLTSSADEEHLVAAIRAGALAYVTKAAGVDQVVAAVRAAARGESVLEPRMAARLVHRLRAGPTRPGPLDRLSPRELEVLAGLARGRSNREVGRALSIGDETVKAHVSSILAKLGVADRTQAAIVALQQGLVPLDRALDADDPRRSPG